MQRLLLAALALVLAPALASASITIDEFEEPPTQLIDTTVDGVPVFDETGAPSSDFNTRYVSVNKTAGGTLRDVAATIGGDPGVGQFTYSEDSGANGSFLIGYDGIDDNFFDGILANDFNFDFTDGGNDTGIVIRAGSDLGVTLDLTIFSNGLQSIASVFVAATGSANVVDYFVPFTDFVGGADFTAVDAFAVSFAANTTSGNDVTIDRIVTSGVPEPASMVLFGLLATGMAGGAAARRRKEAGV